MQILNLANSNHSDILYTIFHFPDGEVQIVLDEFSHKDDIEVRCRITNSEELFIMMQVCDILIRHGMTFYISIYYLMGMRMDRVMDFNRPYTLKVIASVLSQLGAAKVFIFKPHSSKIYDLFNYAWETCSDEWDNFTRETFHKYQIVLPDNGAVKRSGEERAAKSFVIGEKVRDVKTGSLISIKVKNPEIIKDLPLLMIDDLCDGGGTFVGLAKAIREIKPNAKISIAVNHMVNSKGIENLSKNFEHVWFTNSYKDWTDLPENVTQINVI